MAELVGVVASVIAIAGLGARLSKSLYTAGDKAISADHNLNRVASNVALFSGTLKYFATVLQANERLFSDEAKNVALHLLSECEDVFRDLAQLAVMAKGKEDKREAPPGFPNPSSPPGMGGQRPRRLSMVNRFRAYFESPKVELMLCSLEYLKSTLQLLIQTLLLAAATAEAKERQPAEAAVPRETTLHIEHERMHVETLIIARQLSVNILQQKLTQQRDEDQTGRFSPTLSEASSADGTKHVQLLEAPPSTSSLARTGANSIPFLDRGLEQSAGIQAHPAQFVSHSQIIDQLLGRWTRLSEVEQEIERCRRRGDQAEPSNQSSNPPDLVLSKVESPDELANLTPTSSRGQLEPNTGQHRAMPQTTSSLPPPPKGPAPRYSINGKLPTFNRTLSAPEYEAIHLMRTMSPQPNADNMLTLHSGNGPRQPPPNPYKSSSQQMMLHKGSSPAVSPKNSYHQPDGFSNYRSPHVDCEDDTSETGSSFEDEESGLRVDWTITGVVGGIERRWDMMDHKVIGPRTPLIPTESVEFLVKHIIGKTEIRETWVSEQAMKGSGFPYTQELRRRSEYDLPQSVNVKPQRFFIVQQVLRWVSNATSTAPYRIANVV